MIRIQVITLVVSILFLVYISKLIIRGKLREEYAIVWCASTLMLVVFSFWKDGLYILADLFGVFVPANLVFTACIFVILIYLLHLSVVSSKLHLQNKAMAQEIALLKKISKDRDDLKKDKV
ncbi:DUF2304 domain-containing protein [Pedobacter alpinus]|uniref:DUF2304 domain-containing protein n=1 Tax=Pedobacter alpinus TaxID=1590643 RepID=A0ABW5TS63_9SPHI